MAALREPLHLSGFSIETPRCCAECPLFGSSKFGDRIFCNLPDGPDFVFRSTRSDSCPLMDYTFDFEANEIERKQYSGNMEGLKEAIIKKLKEKGQKCFCKGISMVDMDEAVKIVEEEFGSDERHSDNE